MVSCLPICSCSSGRAGSTFAPSSVHQVSLGGGRIVLLKTLVPLSAREKLPKEKRRTTPLARRVACSPARAALGDDRMKETLSSPQFTSKDWRYLGKVLAGCTAGAGVIKYGSILLPQITQPNLVIALLIITAPVVASVVVLNAASCNFSYS